MNKRAKIGLWIVSAVSIIAIFIFMNYVWGASTIKTSSGTTSVTMADDSNAIINISVNVTTAGLNSNITAIIISVPNSFSNLTSGAESQISTSIANNTVANFTMINTNSTINWTASFASYGGYLINDSAGSTLYYFWFNLSSLTPVRNANISVTLYGNKSAVYDSQSNITLNINDTFNVNYIGSTPPDWNNMSQNYIYGAVNVSGNETGVSINMTLSNGTGGGSVAFSNLSGTVAVANASGFIFNFTNLADGLYYLNVTANSTSLDTNVSLTRTFRIDRTAPSVTLTQNNGSTSTTKTKITIDISVSDVGSGVLNSSGCALDSTTAVVTGTGGSQTLTEENLQCGTGYTYAVTCTDTAGNSNTAVSLRVSTSPCGGGSSSSSGGGGSGTTWSSTYVEDDKELSDKGSVTKDLGAKNRIRIKVDGSAHHVGVKSLTSTSATIEVASTPREETLNVGESAKFEVTDDEFYDLMVKLDSIVNNKASITITPIQEQVVATTASAGGGAEPQGGGSAAGTGAVGGLGGGSKTLWIILGLVVLVALVVWIILAVNSKKKKM